MKCHANKRFQLSILRDRKKVDKGVAKSRVQNNLAVTLHKLCSDNLNIHKNLQLSEFIQLIK